MNGRYKTGQAVWYYGRRNRLCYGIVFSQYTENGRTMLSVYEDGKKTKHKMVSADECAPCKWLAVYFRHCPYVVRALGVFIIWGLFWILVEAMVYGKPEDRLVDNIVCIPVLFILYWLFRYKDEKERVEKEQ